MRADPRSPGDNYVSVLPLPWIMEQVYVVGQALISRQIVNFVEEQETMMSDSSTPNLRGDGPPSGRMSAALQAQCDLRVLVATPRPARRRRSSLGHKAG